MKTINETTLDVLLEKVPSHDFIIHDAYDGFRGDYLAMQALLRLYNPRSVMEIGTNIGMGVNCIFTAVPEAQIFSLDLDYETMNENSKQYPLEADGTDRVGSAAREIPYTQLRGDSMTFLFTDMPCEGYYIDGEHDYEHAYHETMQALSCKPKIIIWHDTDMPEVMDGIINAFTDHREEKNYTLTRVEDTRISYAVRHEK